MVATYRSSKKRSVGRKSVKRRNASIIYRKAGNFGLYRSTRFLPLRNLARMARRGGLHAPRIPRTLGSLFPNSGKLMRHKYADRIVLPAATAGLNSVYVMRANSLFDPDLTGVGHQPMFYDDMAAHYNKYTVMWSTLKIAIPNGDDKQRIWGILMCDSSTEINTTSGFVETLEQYSHMNVSRSDKRPAPLILTKKFNAAREFKTTYKGILSDDVHATTVGQNPVAAVERYFIIWCAPLTTSDALSALPITVEMVFSTQWRYSKPAVPS